MAARAGMRSARSCMCVVLCVCTPQVRQVLRHAERAAPGQPGRARARAGVDAGLGE